MSAKFDAKIFIKSKGCKCPFCKSDQIEGGNQDLSGENFTLDMSCLDCGREWQAVYKLFIVVPYAEGESAT